MPWRFARSRKGFLGKGKASLKLTLAGGPSAEARRFISTKLCGVSSPLCSALSAASKGAIMLTRIAIITTLLCSLCLPLSSEPRPLDGRPASVEQPIPAGPGVCRPERPALEAEGGTVPTTGLDEILASCGPDANVRALELIGIYAAIGNREWEEILMARLRARGVSAETINEVVTWSKLHSSSPELRALNAFQYRNAPPVGGGWEASQ